MRRLAVLVTIGALAAACSGDGADSAATGSSTTSTDSTSGAVDDAGPEDGPDEPESSYGWQVVEVVDASRPTDAVRGNDGTTLEAADSRVIRTVVAYPSVGNRSVDDSEAAAPAERDPAPLVVFAHGLGGLTAPADPVLQALVADGYVVAGPNFPETTSPYASAADFQEQPADVSATIDALLDPDDGIADFAARLIDADRIGVVGHSLGGITVYGATLNSCCVDDRIDAAASFAGVWGGEFPGGDFSFPPIPLLLVHGDADGTVPLAQSREVFGLATGPTYLLTLSGTGHGAGIYGGGDDGRLAAYGALTDFLAVHLDGEADSSVLDERSIDDAVGRWEVADNG